MKTPWRYLTAVAAAGTLVAATGLVVHAAGTPRAGTGAGGCFDPVSYGAAPNDGVDDRAPIQAAINDAAAGGGTVCLASGRWTVTRAPVGSYNRNAALSTHSAHLTITGTGHGSVLELVGDQQIAAVSVISLDPGATDIVLERFTIDTSAATNTDEQTHAIGIGSGVCTTANGTCSMPVADITVRDVRFAHPKIADQRKGDCIRLLGQTPVMAVKRVTIAGSSFTNCARSGIAVQRNVVSLAVLGNHFAERIGDTPFDGEPTNGDGDDGLRLIGNSFADSPSTFSATLTSYDHATVTGNTFAGRGLLLYRTRNAIVADNTFDVTALTGGGVIEIGNVAEGIKIDNNVIRRHGVPGPAIRITPHSGGVPGQVSISGNTIVADGDSSGVYGDGVRDIGVRDNTITLPDRAPNGSGIHLQAINGPIDEAMITGNSVAGFEYFAAVRLDSRPEKFRGLTVALNSSRGAVRSLQCFQQNAGGFREPGVSVGNRWNVAPTCSAATFTPGQ